MDLVEELRKAWGWAGLDPVKVVAENDFGNLLILDTQGRYWRLCPEDCYCNIVALDRAALEVLGATPSFLHDWHMRPLIELARKKCGPLSPGKKYNLRLPGLLGGEYGGDNLGITSQVELIHASARVARGAQPAEATEATPDPGP
jgi:hypothetical protein